MLNEKAIGCILLSISYKEGAAVEWIEPSSYRWLQVVRAKLGENTLQRESRRLIWCDKNLFGLRSDRIIVLMQILNSDIARFIVVLMQGIIPSTLIYLSILFIQDNCTVGIWIPSVHGPVHVCSEYSPFDIYAMKLLKISRNCFFSDARFVAVLSENVVINYVASRKCLSCQALALSAMQLFLYLTYGHSHSPCLLSCYNFSMNIFRQVSLIR